MLDPDDPGFAPGWAEPPRELPAVSAPVLASARPTRNVLLDPNPVKYAVQRTGFGVWRRHVSPEGRRFSEFTSHYRVGWLPALHMTFGRDPATGKKTAKGIVAAGQFAVGVFVLAQFGLGLLLGVAQFGTGLVCVGQFALGGLFAVGQFAAAVAVAVLAVGNVAIGVWA